MSSTPSGRPNNTEHRVRLFFGSLLRQTVQPHPMTGTPTDVPDPRTTNCPVMSVVKIDFDTNKLTALPKELNAVTEKEDTV